MGTLVRPVALCVVISGMHVAFSQQNGYPAGELYEQKEREDVYLEQLKQQLPPEEFYREGGEYAEHEKWFRLWQTRVGGHGDPEAYYRVMETYMNWKFNGSSTYKSNNDPWHEIGPKRRRNNMIGIGPIRHIVFNKTNPEHMLCTSPHGGIFFSTNHGLSWQNAGTDLGWPTTECAHAAYYPGAPGSYYPGTLTTWYGVHATGENQGQKIIGHIGGVYRTTNGGADWDRIAAPADIDGNHPLPWQIGLEKILFDDKVNTGGDHTLFLATSNGLWITGNPSVASPAWYPAAINWPPSILQHQDYAGCDIEEAVLVRDMAYLPIAGTSIMAATMRFTVACTTGYDQNNQPIIVKHNIWRLMRSDNDGVTWNEIGGQPAINPALHTCGVETTPAEPSLFVFLLGTRSTYDGEIHSYAVGNNAWSTNSNATGFRSSFNTSHEFAVSTDDANSVLLANHTSMIWLVSGVNQLLNYSNPGQHDDVESIVPDPVDNGVYWVANHGGIDRLTISNGAGIYEDHSDGLGVGEVTSFASAQTTGDYLALTLFHDGGAINRSPYSSQWDPDWAYLERYKDGLTALMDRSNPDRVYHGTQNGTWNRHDNATLSTNDDAAFTSSGEFWSEGELHRASSDVIFMNTDVNNGQTVGPNNQPFTNNEPEVIRSFDGGQTGINPNPNLSFVISDFRSNPMVCKSADTNSKHDDEMIKWIRSSPANHDHLYVCLQDYLWRYRIYRNTDINNPDISAVRAAWEEVPVPRYWDAGGVVITSIAFHPEDDGVVFIAYSTPDHSDPNDWSQTSAEQTVFRLDVSDLSQYGAGTGTFDCTGPEPCDDLTMNLPNTFDYRDALVYEEGSDEGLYVATEFGVYFTDRKRRLVYDPLNPQDPDDPNNNAGWVRLGDGLPHCVPWQLEINYAINRIRIGFYGRGLWEHGLHCPDQANYTESGTYSASDFLEARETITSTAVVPSGLSMRYRAGEEVKMTPGFHASAGTDFRAFIHPCDVAGNSFIPKNADVVISEENGKRDQPPATLLVWPNPSTGLFSLSLRYQTPIDEPMTVTVFDSQGRAVSSIPYVQGGTTVDLSGRTGLFAVTLSGSAQRHTTKVLVH